MISMQQVEKRYGGVKALDGLDLEVEEGSVVGLIGPNGAGKTTSMLVMSTLLGRDGGSVTVAGEDPQRSPEKVRKVLGYMPDFFGFYDHLTAREYLEFFASTQHVPGDQILSVTEDLLGLVDLDHKADAEVNTLSRGMKQRLSLARALVHDPRLLILDEPASGLDPRARVQLRELIAELSRMGKTVVISSHILSELEGICTHLAVVDQGKVRAFGDLNQIRSALVSGRRVVARLPDEQVDQALEIVNGDLAVSEVEVERGRLRFMMAGDDEVSSRLLAGLVEAGVPVSEWRLDAAGLEEIFLQITAQDEAEQ
jgi:ABC-2 type transport system ATP-binding protein